MSYFGGGMNLKDWLLLKWDQIIDGVIYKERSKTDEPLTIPITKPLQDLIDCHSSPGEYVFDFIDHSLPPERFHIRYMTFLNNMRRSLMKVKKELGIEKKLTPYMARHTHANVLLNKNASFEQIKESLGQKDIRSTKAYTGSLSLNKRREVANLLFEEE